MMILKVFVGNFGVDTNIFVSCFVVYLYEILTDKKKIFLK